MHASYTHTHTLMKDSREVRLCNEWMKMGWPNKVRKIFFICK